MSPRPVQQRRGPLAGVRVADFCWMGVGSVATRLLADFGAEVIKIENRKRLDMPRRLPLYKGEGRVRSYGEEDPNPNPEKGGLFNNYARNKLGITLNMGEARGREIAEELIRRSSVVTENFAPGVMEKWGLTYDHVKSLREDVIYARMSGYGHSGPHEYYRSYGPVIQAVSGLSFNSGLPGREPSGWGLSYMDNQAAYYNSAAILVAIFDRHRTGRGAEIDVSAVEVGDNLLGAELLDTLVNQRPSRRPDFPRGNRLEYPAAAPHGVYPAAGDDQWVAIAVFDDAQWGALVTALGSPPWAADPVLANQESRYRHQDLLDARLTEWTRHRDKFDVMALLQNVGVPAAAVQNSADLAERDPQIAEYDTFFELDHPVIGPARFEGVPVDFSRSEPDNWRSAPLLGEDNAYVYGSILGLSESEQIDLAEAGVI